MQHGNSIPNQEGFGGDKECPMGQGEEKLDLQPPAMVNGAVLRDLPHSKRQTLLVSCEYEMLQRENFSQVPITMSINLN